MKMRILTACLIGMVMALSIQVMAADCWWDNGGIGDDWSTPANWTGNVIPTTSDRALINGSADLTQSGCASYHTYIGVGSGYGSLDMSAGDLSVSGMLYLGYYSWDLGELDVRNYSTLNVSEHFFVGPIGKGEFRLYDGTVNVTQSFTIGNQAATGRGYVDLYGGTVNCNSFNMGGWGGDCLLNLAHGRLIIDGDHVAEINTYIANGWITAFGGSSMCEVKVDYNQINPGKTTVRAAPSFGKYDHLVTTSFFAWFCGATCGQYQGPWRPLDGRANWDGSVDWWKTQIKQAMTANIDILLVHHYNGVDQQRTNLFTALGEMRADDYDVPKIAPFLDPLIIWNGSSVDVSTTAGKNEFVGHYTNFYNQYYSGNTDPEADGYIAQIDGRVLLDTWHLLTVQNTGSLAASDISSRLTAALPGHPIYGNGIYYMQTNANPTFTFSDEKVDQFRIHAYYAVADFNGIQNAQVMPGYWDQNIRTPGYFLARNGGSNYDGAWNSVLNNASLDRVYVESWNEYDEGTGIYAGDVGSPYIIPPNPSNDTFSTTSDPFEYITTTREGASEFNDVPDRDARIISHTIPNTMTAGQTVSIQVTVRNEGDLMWSEDDNFRLGFRGDFFPTETRSFMNDTTNEIPTYGGIFRGRPITFTFNLTAPATAGTYEVRVMMLQELITWFGQERSLKIVVS